ncbi:hypothetical protein ABIB68_007037 [Bradyrhizobium sp. F1.2.2]
MVRYLGFGRGARHCCRYCGGGCWGYYAIGRSAASNKTLIGRRRQADRPTRRDWKTWSSRGDSLFTGHRSARRSMTTRQYVRLLSGQHFGIGLDLHQVGTRSQRQQGNLIYRRTGNLRAVQLLLGHTKIGSTVRYLEIEVDDALAIAGAGECLNYWAERTCSAHLLRPAPGQKRPELSLKVGDGGNRKGGISWGCLTPPLLHRRSDMPCPKITSSS